MLIGRALHINPVFYHCVNLPSMAIFSLKVRTCKETSMVITERVCKRRTLESNPALVLKAITRQLLYKKSLRLFARHPLKHTSHLKSDIHYN